MKMRPMNKIEHRKVRELLREGERLYGSQKDNRIIDHVQKGMIEAGYRIKVPVREPYAV